MASFETAGLLRSPREWWTRFFASPSFRRNSASGPGSRPKSGLETAKPCRRFRRRRAFLGLAIGPTLGVPVLPFVVGCGYGGLSANGAIRCAGAFNFIVRQPHEFSQQGDRLTLRERVCRLRRVAGSDTGGE